MKIEVDNLIYSYDKYEKEKTYALNGASLTIEEGDFMAIVGRTGCGKSTLACHLNGLLKPDSGRILIDGKNIYDKDFDLVSLRYKVSIVFQYPEYQLFAEDVLTDVCFGAINKGLSKEEAEKKSKEILESLNFDMKKITESPFTISGGEKRKVALAGVLVMEPEVLILDEPQAGLDQLTKLALYKLIEEMHKKGKTIIIISHNLEDAVEYCNKVCLMDQGKVIKVGTAYDIFMDDEIVTNYKIDIPENVYIAKELKKKYGDRFDATKIKRQDLADEILNLKK